MFLDITMEIRFSAVKMSETNPFINFLKKFQKNFLNLFFHDYSIKSTKNIRNVVFLNILMGNTFFALKMSKTLYIIIFYEFFEKLQKILENYIFSLNNIKKHIKHKRFTLSCSTF